jgi:hypothetical protein
MIAGQCSPLISTEYGVGFWDADKGELRLFDSVLVNISPVYAFAANANEVRIYFESRATRRAQLTAYYAAPGDKGD